MVIKSFAFLHLWVVVVTGSNIWTAMYSAEECLDSALLQDAIVAAGECVVGTLSDGTTVSPAQVPLFISYDLLNSLIALHFML